jgi:hypothetical protein
MIMRRSLLTCLTLLLLSSFPVTAQGMIFGIDAGYRTDRFENGFEMSGPAVGVLLGAVVLGTTSENFSVLVPVVMEAKFASGDRQDLAINGDLAFRFSNIAMGVGADFRMPMAPDVEEPVRSSETVWPDDVEMLGFSGFARLNFGPQQRIFVQGRVSGFPPGLTMRLTNPCSNEFTSNLPPEHINACYDAVSKQIVPEFKSAGETRAAIGYVFNTAVFQTTTLRVMWTRQKFDYDLVGKNRNGAWNRTTEAISIGLVLQ